MNVSDRDLLKEELRDLDRRIAGLGIDVWIGAEPTFTDRFSESPEWLNKALGGDKEHRAEQTARRYLAAFPGAALLRCIGRQYPGEDCARWSLGVFARRDGKVAWSGPPDPLLLSDAVPATDPALLSAWRDALVAVCAERQWPVRTETLSDGRGERLLLRMDPGQPVPMEIDREQCLRPSIHAGPVPEAGLKDDLAAQGLYLLQLGLCASASGPAPCAELPLLEDTGRFLKLLQALSQASLNANLPCLMLTGFPPPMDREVCCSTLTPDPAVIEANLAPAADLDEFRRLLTPLFEAADAEGLSAYRLHYNGREQDSGGGGQITVGGPTAADSPFFRQPRLLPRLIRYFNRHPGLSYWFATEYVGSGSQGPRPDEGLRERFLELDLALERIEAADNPTPETIWTGLAPLLVDASGNSHRSELNVEKLWNPYLGGRGHLGLVELRPFRMAPTTASLCALAALVRALVARLMSAPFTEPLRDWGDELHRRFALPHFMREDLHAVLDDLAAHGVGLGEALIAQLLDDGVYRIGNVSWQGARIHLRRALEFWPLLGDLTTQQPRDSRLVDASTARVEILIQDPGESPDDWELRIEDYAVPLSSESGEAGNVMLAAVRYRSFVPWMGLHPALPARDRVRFTLVHRPSASALQLCLHEWRPDGLPYSGLPTDREEAVRRRQERIAVQESDPASLAPALEAPPAALGPYCLDLRRVPAPASQPPA